ncbi:hypothetical protein [Candidatus Nitrotoga sp. M5]|uniref:hypothetical protein n=1 Tax=Candidatus Nitrotoga sp. M5 TaxID=2890409 RepID=UPI001EF6F7EB|nr:hypothetical protein [Candidatus Nitrotoga sp. M5]CAH1387068.1 hypothetical protein NTGM5_480064 [Candidatus Nitrotoga sp. M5]
MLNNQELNNLINNAKREIKSILKKLEDDANITVTDIRISELDITTISDTASKTIRSIEITIHDPGRKGWN